MSQQPDPVKYLWKVTFDNGYTDLVHAATIGDAGHIARGRHGPPTIVSTIKEGEVGYEPTAD